MIKAFINRRIFLEPWLAKVFLHGVKKQVLTKALTNVPMQLSYIKLRMCIPKRALIKTTNMQVTD